MSKEEKKTTPLANLHATLAEELATLQEREPVLSKKERAGAARFRRGGHVVVMNVVTTSRQKAVVVPGIPIEEVERDLVEAEEAEAAYRISEQMTQTLKDAVLRKRGRAWSRTMIHYKVLDSAAREDPGIAIALEPVRKFMALGKRGDAAAPTTEPAPEGSQKLE